MLKVPVNVFPIKFFLQQLHQIAFTEDLDNRILVGAQISIVQCSGLSNNNTVTLVEKSQTFSSCPIGVYKVRVDYSSNFTFTYNLMTSPISFTAVIQPIIKPHKQTILPQQFQ
uniref:Uncharacterized protein n=1 Tax=Panagrolaimus superbus TaxID=310955 RepID=A0A914YVC9_9BILA